MFALMNKRPLLICLALASVAGFLAFTQTGEWQSKFVSTTKDGIVKYIPDEKGNIIPDFSRVGYHYGERQIPNVDIKKIIAPSADAAQQIQKAIDELARQPVNKNGFRGAILLKKGNYVINGKITITASGIVLRGEGDETKLVAAGTVNRPLIEVTGTGILKEIKGSRTKILDDYVPVGAKSFRLTSSDLFKAGDR